MAIAICIVAVLAIVALLLEAKAEGWQMPLRGRPRRWGRH